MQVIDFYRATYSQNEIDLIDNKISDYRELDKNTWKWFTSNLFGYFKLFKQ